MRLALMLFLATTPPALAQSVVHEVWGPTQSFGFSEVVESAGDVNLDGVPDYVVTNPFAYSHAAPIVTIHSGDTGAIIGQIAGPSVNVAFGISIAAGRDIDGDSVPDLIIGAALGTPSGQQPPLLHGSAFVYSGANQTPIRSHANGVPLDEFGFNVSFLDDIDGDGVAEYSVRSRFGNNAPNTVDIYSGLTGQWIRRHVNQRSVVSQQQFGTRVVSLGDLDLDTVSDYAIAAPLTSQTIGTQQPEGSVVIYSGLSGAVLRTDWGSGPLTYGLGLDALGDIDGDTYVDYATTNGGGADLLVVSGGTGAVVTSCTTSPNHSYGPIVRAVQDLDGDALSDILVSEWGLTTFDTPYATAVSSVSGGVLYKYERPVTASPLDPFYPGNLVDLGDVDGDGLHEWAVGHIYETDPQSGLRGSVRVISVRPLYTHPDEVQGSVGKVGLELNAGMPNRNSPFLVLASMTGTAGIPIGGESVPLTYDLLTQFSILAYNTVIFGDTLGVTDQLGTAAAFFDRSYVPVGMQGSTFWFAYVGLGPAGYFVSNAEALPAAGVGAGS